MGRNWYGNNVSYHVNQSAGREEDEIQKNC